MKNTKCYYLIFSQKDFLENQVIEELIRERSNYYISENKNPDFWVLNSPKFIKQEAINKKIKTSNFYKLKNSQIIKNNEEYYSSILTFNEEFYVWMQLRLGDFEDINLDKLEINKVYNVDGIKGEFLITEENINLLNSEDCQLNPELITKKFSNFIQYV